LLAAPFDISPIQCAALIAGSKVKNPAALAVTREAEEDWNGKPNRKPGVNE
jgi:hypothetical protein